MNRAGTIVDRERGAKAENRVARHSRVWNPIFVCEIRHGACGLFGCEDMIGDKRSVHHPRLE